MGVETENMSALEMNMRSRELLFKNLRDYHGEPVKKPELKSMFASYEEAKQAGNTCAMISFKRREHEQHAKKLIALSHEVYETKSISEIQSGIKELEVSIASGEETVELLKEAQERKYRKEFSKIGGLTGINLAEAISEAMDNWARQDERYLAAMAELQEVKKTYTAYSNAKEMYIEDHADLIAEARENARRKEFSASGILEEMGITPAKDNSDE